MEYETAGDPMTGLKWTRRTTEKIATELAVYGGIEVSPNTVARILKELGYSLRVNHKKISSGTSPDRDIQFQHIFANRELFIRQGLPVVSVDTKKKELVGKFKNAGTAWNNQAVVVKDHDFRSQGLGLAVPYGIYDVQANRGSVFIGVSHDTPQFAVSSIEKWWRYDGRHRYSEAEELLILADCGGSNGYRCRLWKHALQEFSNRQGITITVNHYPPGTSKWNPIEHRLFSEISKNWAGRPLDSFETVRNYITTTSTKTGLRVKAYIDNKIYEKGIKIDAQKMKELNILKDDQLSNWNYTISPS